VPDFAEQNVATLGPRLAALPLDDAAGGSREAAEPSPGERPAGDDVTVLIAAYNAAPFLSRAVNSALEQNRPPLEVLIVDDGSLDETVEVARELAARDSRIRLLCLDENRGPAGARNAGIDHARGEWIAVLDADDAFLPDRLERLLKIAKESNADVVADNFIWYAAADGSQGAPGLSPSPSVEVVDKEKYVARARPFAHEADWGLLKPVFRSAFLNAHRLRYPLFSRHGEDFLLMVEVLLAGGRYILSRTPGYLYTTRSSGLSRTRVDYETMAAHTLALIRDDRLRADQRFRDLLAERYAAVKRLSAEAKVAGHLRDRHYARIAVRMLSDYHFLRATLSILKSKARRWLNRPETVLR
jgi:succinoglycan biosynthesis protein ExoO